MYLKVSLQEYCLRMIMDRKYLMMLLACLNKLLVLYLLPPNLILLLTISHWTVLFADYALIVTDIALRAGKDNALLVEWRIQDSLL